MPRPILLLDVMGTLVTEPFLADIPRFFGMTLEELVRIKHPTSWIEFEHGRIDEDEYCKTFFTDGRSLDKQHFKAMMRDAYEWMDGVEALLAELKEKGYAMHALSNYSCWYQIIEEKLRVSRFVEWSFVSCDTGFRKPDAEAYLIAPRTLGVTPEECLFVDDRKKNVEAAEAVGMQAILRTPNIAELRSELKRAGIV